MKKSVVFSIHILYWLLILASPLAATLVLKHGNLPFNGKVELNTISYSTLQLYASYSRPFLFYAGYLLVPFISWNCKRITYIGIGLLLAYISLYLFSKEIFSLSFYLTRVIVAGMMSGIFLRLAIDWYSKRKKLKQLQQENLESNLALLKHQLNPHFLFNTLHNIDSLIYIDKEKASKSIEKLSDIMRYMLKDATVDFVPLDDELTYLKNYIELERLRLKNQKFLNLTISTEGRSLSIAPMILLPFVENAFKHASDSATENGISISIKLEDKQLLFFCKNSYNPNEAEKDRSNGIGLSTVEERLNLIYPERHSLDINSADSTYSVKLKLTLHDH